MRDQLASMPPDDRTRLRFLERALRQHPVLLVLDNFEDNLTAGAAAFADPGTSKVIKHLAESCTTGRLLVTCRHPLPGMREQLRHLGIGPLSPSETRRLFLRLPGLRTLTGEDAALVHRLVGGHPRVLEFLDALLRLGVGTDQVCGRFSELADAHGVEVTQPRELPEQVSMAVQLGARDICLDVLLAALDNAERQVLLQTAVSSLPVQVADLTAALDHTRLDDITVTHAAQRLADLSLVVHTDEGLWVHRWTAEGLREHETPDDYRNRCRRAGELRQRRIASASRDVTEWIEATQNFLDAQDWDRATKVATRVADFLAQDSNLRRLSFTAQVLAALPPQHHDYHLFVDHEGASLVALRVHRRGRATLPPPRGRLHPACPRRTRTRRLPTRPLRLLQQTGPLFHPARPCWGRGRRAGTAPRAGAHRSSTHARTGQRCCRPCHRASLDRQVRRSW
ncbi:MAG: hypothetical protein ACRDRS_13230 [Pseudonocardiaceae bacterium]